MEGDGNVYAHSSLWMRPTRPDRYNMRIDYSHIVLIIAIWPGDRIRRPEHSTVEHGSCNESV